MFASKDTLLTRPSGYNIARSVRLRSSASAYLSRTPASAGNRKKWTWSAWVKRGIIDANYQTLFSGSTNATGTNTLSYVAWANDYSLILNDWNGTAFSVKSSAVYRDPSAWYHIVVAVDTTQATASNRVSMYVNGVQITSFALANYPTQNYDFQINNAVIQTIGSAYWSSAPNLISDGYQTEINFIDGQALTPSSFGSTNAITGVWQPAKYTGTYGTNGFYLNFSDNSSNTATTIGKDYSGNGNNWTPNNISVTAGATYDSMTDVPTLTSATAANYCVLNPLQVTAASIGTASDGNSSWSCGVSASYGKIYGTMAIPSTGKYYWEVTVGSTVGLEVGIISASDQSNNYSGYSPNGYTYYIDGTKGNNNVYTSYGASFTTGNVIGVAYDAGAGTLVLYKNNTSQGTAFSGLTGTYVATLGNASSSVSTSAKINFGQQPFTYTPPTGYVALNTYNLPDSTIKNGAGYMAATLYTGTGASLTVANTVGSTSFQPDWVWVKGRSGATDHALYDSVRGVQKQIESNTATAETTETTGLTAFGSTGFTVGALAQMNTSAATYVAWQWKAGTTSASNTNGSITSTVSVGATQGFSVVTYTGNGTSGATVGHGLGVTPAMIIGKNRSGSAQNWQVWHQSMGDNVMQLNLTNAQVASTSNSVFLVSGINSSVFQLGTNPSINGGGTTQVAYCFAAVKGFSAFGSYTGNGSADGPFVFTGFRPRFVMWKRITTAGGHWGIIDSGRNTYNLANLSILANASDGDATNVQVLDLVSNGFKIRTSDGGQNLNADTFIYAAFAEVPFKSALAR
jgi:hypothetical protein